MERKTAYIVCGQGISLCFALALLFTQLLSRSNVTSPAFQAIFVYLLLAIVFASIFYFRQLPSVNFPWWFWCILGFVDAQANYCFILAHRGNVNFASLAGILHLTVPFAMLLSFLVLHRRYTLHHLVGTFIAFTGSLVIYFTYNDPQEYTDQGKGNFWALLASLFYAVSNLMSEYAVKHGSFDANVECLGKIGITGAVSLALQILFFERDTIATVNWSGANILYLLCFVLAMFVLYTLLNIFLRVAESLLLNLSILTTDTFNIIFNYICFSGSIAFVYWIAVGLNFMGTIIYSSCDPPHDDGDVFGELGTPPLDKTIEICSTP
ncbi:Drug/Metabolite Transporter (DMT) Superfamily [Thraustotheca clavata]|uniref:Drug/Metabolite Transporter (DMT) Superfamily n=1 Tax=Thraustotheca clavata TaxID=74557 RepID=A0A1V9ZWH1_9STRA|nr:Drug/Metabolite Transporter (DMT) Superfamily [Thraustotheca clavata]